MHTLLTHCCRVHVQYGPLFVETQIDPAKGGKVTGTRMSRTYELVVPEKGVDESVVIRMHVTSFDGYPPPSFRQNGRIVSNKVGRHTWQTDSQHTFGSYSGGILAWQRM